MPTKIKETFPARVQLEALSGHPSASVGVTVKTGSIVKQGDVVGKITVGGLYRRRSRTNTVGTGFSNASPVGEVEDAGVFKAADVLKTAAGVAIGTVAANGIDTEADPNTVTLTGNAANNVAADVGVIAQDGSQVAEGIADAETDGTADTPIAVIVSGKLVEAKLRGLDASAKSELAGASVAGGIFKF
jgi:hypothetical protein